MKVHCLTALVLVCACTSVRVAGDGTSVAAGGGRGSEVPGDENSPRPEQGTSSLSPRVVVVSIDGCRWDYVGDEGLVNLRDMMERGAYADAVEVTNPSMTAPGHITLLTGAWSGKHGIVFNKFYDRELGLVKFFGGIPPAEQTYYLLAEPVWVTAEAAGLTTAAVHWAATAGEYAGRSVDYAAPFDSSWSDEQRFAEGIRMIEEHDPDLLLIYATGVSPASYAHGAGSPEVKERLREIDSLIGKLRKAINESSRAETTTLMVVSDHGFGPPLKLELCLSRLLSDADIPYEFIVWGAIGHVFLTDRSDTDQAAALIEPLEGVAKVFREAEADQLHLATKNRTGDLIVLTKPGYQVANMWRPCDGPVVEVQEGYELAGTHGHPAADHADMRGIFIAAGPRVEPAALGPVKQIDIAPTISSLLGIASPAQADGQPLESLR